MRQGTAKSVFRLWAMLMLVVCVGCKPKFGDACAVNTDCSVQADRHCDISQVGGYCTFIDCAPRTCKGEGYCVRFNPDDVRLASTWCMANCDGGCRDGYRCVSVEELNAERGERIVELFDDAPGARFCVQVESAE